MPRKSQKDDDDDEVDEQEDVEVEEDDDEEEEQVEKKSKKHRGKLVQLVTENQLLNAKLDQIITTLQDVIKLLRELE